MSETQRVLTMQFSTAHRNLDSSFLICSHDRMVEYGEVSFKVVRLERGGQEVIARAGNYELCKAAFDKALFIYPTQNLELRQGARVICKSKEG
jgi:hypothetical protein